MNLQERIAEDLKAAMKVQDKVRMGTLRMVKTALKNQEIDSGPLDEAAGLAVLMRLCKQRKESIEVFSKNDRQDLADKESQELAIIEAYLPAGVSEEEISQAVDQAIAETGASSPKQMGQVIGKVMARFQGRPLDGKLVSGMVKARLSPG